MRSPALPLALILLLPLAGLLALGQDIRPFLEFPPRPVILAHAPFSTPVFVLILCLVLAATLPLVIKGLAYRPAQARPAGAALPWWGKAAAVSLVLFWMLAWTRQQWFAPLQAHTFFPLWISLIILINGLTEKRSGSCPMTASPKTFITLFGISALFWWVFEYLNRFVGNWYYTGSQYPGMSYFLLATLSFSTVLPAVESMKAFLMSFERMAKGFTKGPALPWLLSPRAGWMMTAVGAISLAAIGPFPDPLFFTVWTAPFCLLLGHGLIFRRPHPFEGLATGDLTGVAAYAAAAVCCGFFWEMFNVYSLARWEYHIPYVQALHLFEMPLLGYAGYLPFGLECALIIHLTHNAFSETP